MIDFRCCAISNDDLVGAVEENAFLEGVLEDEDLLDEKPLLLLEGLDDDRLDDELDDRLEENPPGLPSTVETAVNAVRMANVRYFR